MKTTNEFEKQRRRRGIETGHYVRLMHGTTLPNKQRAAKRPGKGQRNSWKKEI